MRYLSRSSSLEVQRAEKQQDNLLPFFVISGCTYCFDSADGEQDVEEGSVQHSKPLGAQDALHQTAKSFQEF